MLTFVQGEESVFGEEFFLSPSNQNPPYALLSAFFSVNSPYFVKEFHYKKGFGIEDMSQWKVTRDRVGMGTFENSNGKKFAIRLDLVQSAAAKFGREKCLKNNHLKSWKPHVFIPYSEESQKRGITIENSVGFFMVVNTKAPTNLIPFVIVEIVPESDKMGEITESVSFQMGKILSDTHKAGIIHGHPHLLNWILVGGNPRLVDAKALLIDSDFPWCTCLDRVHSFGDMCTNDCAYVINGLEESRGSVDAFQDGYRSI